ncbi:conserved hypothetical protein [Candidatus Magnetomoraceae bacterium gMMP-1]
MILTYQEISKACEVLGYRDKLRLAQLLIQLARKEEEIQNPQKRNDLKSVKKNTVSENPTEDIDSIQYVTGRLTKLRPAKKKSLLNSIRSMYQFQGGISEKGMEAIIDDLEKQKFLKIDNNKVIYLKD